MKNGWVGFEDFIVAGLREGKVVLATGTGGRWTNVPLKMLSICSPVLISGSTIYLIITNFVRTFGGLPRFPVGLFFVSRGGLEAGEERNFPLELSLRVFCLADDLPVCSSGCSVSIVVETTVASADNWACDNGG